MKKELEFLAKNVIEWRDLAGASTTVLLWNDRMGGPEWLNLKYFPDSDGVRREEWQDARNELGLLSPFMTLEEEELPAIEYKRTAEQFLLQAGNLLTERGKQYDQPAGERSMGRTVEAFNAITGKDLSEYEGWLLMSLLKRVRQANGYHKDSAEDAVSYAALEAEALERGL